MYMLTVSDLISLSDFYVFLISYQRNRTKTFSQKLLDVYAVLIHLTVCIFLPCIIGTDTSRETMILLT